jgi:hypothetical protein
MTISDRPVAVVVVEPAVTVVGHLSVVDEGEVLVGLPMSGQLVAGAGVHVVRHDGLAAHPPQEAPRGRGFGWRLRREFEVLRRNVDAMALRLGGEL